MFFITKKSRLDKIGGIELVQILAYSFQALAAIYGARFKKMGPGEG